MPGKRKRSKEQDLTGRYLAGDLNEDHADQNEQFNKRLRNAQANKMAKTTAMRAAAPGAGPGSTEDLETHPIGQVIQVFSRYCEVEHDKLIYLCTTRKTVSKSAESQMVVGDRVRFRTGGTKDELGRPEAIIEQVLPRDTILSRPDSFNRRDQHPIVANADQMLIVASIVNPTVKWGLIDRMLIAAQSGKLKPILVLNKIDLVDAPLLAEAQRILDLYASLEVKVLQTSIESKQGLDDLRDTLKDRSTVLAGHSGVGKSSLIRAIQPALDIRVGEVSEYTDKGRHTTTSARRYVLDFGGAVIDTPGVKVFGLWNVTRENLDDYFPDVVAGSAPPWRTESYERIRESLPE